MLDLKYPEGFLNFISSLSFVKLDIFQIFQVDCIATTSIYTRFMAIMAAPLVLVLLLHMLRIRKQRQIRKGALLLGPAKTTAMCAKVNSDTAGRCFATVFFLYPMLSSTVFRMFICRGEITSSYTSALYLT